MIVISEDDWAGRIFYGEGIFIHAVNKGVVTETRKHGIAFFLCLCGNKKLRNRFKIISSFLPTPSAAGTFHPSTLQLP